MKKIIIVFSFVSASILFHSCSTDFNVIAPYRETMVIYGLLNPLDAVQYVRISKAFLGEGNSLVMAQQKDSINYANILDVKMQRIINGIPGTPFQLQRDTSIEKEGGLFNSPFQVIYKTFPFNPILQDGSSYKLIVRNTQTGLTATSETKIIDDLVITSPSTLTNPLNPLSFYSNIFFSIEFTPSTRNAWVYNLTLRFHYKEVNVVSNTTTSKYVDWNFRDQVTGSNHTATVVYDQIYRPDLYRIVGNAVPPADTNVIKRIIASPPDPASDSTIELIFTAGTEDLYTYQQLTQPSYGIIQDRPLFSNIENGIGLFTSRYIKSVFKKMDTNSRAAFDTSRYTKDIHFIHQ